MEETIYQQAWTQTFAGECLKVDADTFISKDMFASIATIAHQVAREAVLRFDHAKMQAAIDAKREATDAAMEGK